MPALEAEIQVAGFCEPLDTFVIPIEQPTDHVGRPNADVLVKPILVTFSGMAAVQNFFTEWAMDHYMRRSGQIVVYEQGQTRWRLSFYDAWCVVYAGLFDPGNKAAAHQLTLALSPAAVAINGIHVERHTDLWWEKNPATRLAALTKPADPLPSPSLRAALPPPVPVAIPAPVVSPITGAPQLPKPPKEALDPKNKPLYAPTISKWYKKGGSIEVLDNGNWKFTDWEHNAVEYEDEEPNFDDYARQEVDIDDMQGNCTTDFAQADEKAPEGPKLDENTWHHQQNMKTMQEVPYEIHRRFTHFGGRFMIKQTKGTAPARKKTFTKRGKPS